ncbi:MAG TPA: hypothetical protein VJ860_21855 [Polyangia bacterium]|nr:hypothetical protein [Polyangia bacterium]
MSADKQPPSAETDEMLVQEGLAFLHQARETHGLHPWQVDLIERRLFERGVRSRRTALWPGLAALALVLATSATLAVAQGGLRALPLIGALFAPPSVPATTPTKPEPRRRPAMLKLPAGNQSAANPSGPAPSLAPIPEAVSDPVPVVEPVSAEALQAPAPVHRATTVPRPLALRAPLAPREGAGLAETSAPTPIVAREENPIVAESHSFASVIEPWHRTHNASVALALLDAHERRYPHGHMHVETRVLRAEIYLAQDRESEALAVLDSLALAGLPRGRELQVVRGELRIKAGRCPEGKRDLGDVLEKGVADPLAERALRAIHHCP